MTDSNTAPIISPREQERKQREAAAMRENLKKRKAFQKATQQATEAATKDVLPPHQQHN